MIMKRVFVRQCVIHPQKQSAGAPPLIIPVIPVITHVLLVVLVSVQVLVEFKDVFKDAVNAVFAFSRPKRFGARLNLRLNYFYHEENYFDFGLEPTTVVRSSPKLSFPARMLKLPIEIFRKEAEPFSI